MEDIYLIPIEGNSTKEITNFINLEPKTTNERMDLDKIDINYYLYGCTPEGEDTTEYFGLKIAFKIYS